MKIFSQYIDDKFINSLSVISNMETASGVINNNLYEIHYRYNFDTYIFCANLCTPEIYQFIEEFITNKNIVLYHHDTTLVELINNLPKKCIHISHNIDSFTRHIPRLVNTDIFIGNKQTERNNDIICFLDGYTTIPDELMSLLYPKSNKRIKFFNKNITHAQNLGFVNEAEKAELLNSCDAYLDLDGSYYIEAKLCGASVIKILNNDLVKDQSLDIPSYTSYSLFLQQLFA